MRIMFDNRLFAAGFLACFALGGMLLAGCGGDSDSESSDSSDTAEVHPEWMTSYEDAMARSKETNRPVFAFFTGSDW